MCVFRRGMDLASFQRSKITVIDCAWTWDGETDGFRLVVYVIN